MTEFEEIKAELATVKAELVSTKQTIKDLEQEIKALKKLRLQDMRISELQLRKTRPLNSNQSFNRG